MKSLFRKILVGLAVTLSVLSLQLAAASPSPVLAAGDASACKYTTNGSGDKAKVSQPLVDNCLAQSPVITRIQQVVDFLSAGVAIIVVGVVLVGGIQYILAGGNATAVTAARKRIGNGIIALFAFLFMYAFLQWLIPGGIFK